MTRERCYCCGKFMPEGRGYPPLEEDRCDDCEERERPSRLYRTGLRNDFTQCELRAAKEEDGR